MEPPHSNINGILIERADNLKRADIIGSSDPYVVARLGPLGSAWADKSQQTERISDTISGSSSPVWHFAFSYASPPSGEAWEVHCRVYDHDLVTRDDFLGECVVALDSLDGHANELRTYPLHDGQGTLSLMSGAGVEAALLDEIEAELRSAKPDSLVSAGTALAARLMAPVGGLTSKVRQWFAHSSGLADDYFGWAGYQFNMFRLHLCSNAAPQRHGDAISTFFTKFSNARMEWPGPFPNHCVAYSSYKDVVEQLQALGQRLGRDDVDGSLVRENFLGNMLLNGHLWPEVPWHSIGLGAPVEAHAWARPLLVKLMGPTCTRRLGGEAWLDAQASRFLAGRRRLRLPQDTSMYVAQVQHEVMLGMTLTDDEASDFAWLQGHFLVSMVMPPSLLEVAKLRVALEVDKVLAQKAAWLERYQVALRRLLPEETNALGPERTAMLASFVLDATLFAGGLSVPTVLGYALTLPWSQWGHEHLPSGFSLDNPNDIPAYVLEIIRIFAPVKFVSFKERPTSEAEARRVMLNIQMAARDPAVWGDDAMHFKLRPLSIYHKFGVSFAEQAIDPLLDSAGSRSCPGKDFGLQSIFAFVRAFARVAAPYGGVKSLWVARRPMVPGDALKPGETTDARIAMPPEELTLDYNGSAPFELHWLESAVYGEEGVRSGEQLFEGLSTEEKAKLESIAKSKRLNKIQRVNRHTLSWVQIVYLSVDPTLIGSAVNVSTDFLPKGVEAGDMYECGFGGLRILCKDEDLKGSAVRTLTLHIVNQSTAHLLDNLEDDEKQQPLLYWGEGDGKETTEASRAEAYACIDAVFGDYLPAQFNTWDDLHTDEGFAALCVVGVGAWYLSAARTAEATGHVVPEGAAMECNIEYLANYEVRESWICYGATAYLSAAPADGSLPAVLGVWSCHLQRLVAPAEPLWEHAKATFKMTLGTSLTLKDHLGFLHWIVGNGMCIATRTALSEDHPLRRLLKQHYFATSSINDASKESLMPVKGLAHRTFGLSADGWVQALGDVTKLWKYTPFPVRISSSGLPAEFMERWPMAVDGLAVWRATEAYVRSFLSIFFADDAAVQADGELVEFWASFETQFDTPWALPPLAFDPLVTLVTELIFSVTATHELVGSIVQYLLSPAGLPGKLANGAVEPDVQSHAQSLCIIALTGIRQPPLMDDWAHLFHVPKWADEGKQQAVLDAVRHRQVELDGVARAIDERNEARARTIGRRFVAFNPRTHETSISI